jgi:hypothetical protein
MPIMREEVRASMLAAHHDLQVKHPK